MIENESLADVLLRMESMDNWQKFVEDAWIRMSQAAKVYFEEDGGMKNNSLVVGEC